MSTTGSGAATLPTAIRGRRQRLRQLRRLVRAGRYVIPPKTVARALLHRLGLEPPAPNAQQR